MRVITSILVAGVLSTAGAAAGVSGVIGADYDRTGSPGDALNSFGGSGQLLLSFNEPGLNLQLGGGGAKAFTGDASTVWIGNADFFWRDARGTFGTSVSHGSFQFGDVSPSLTAFGSFGEWYATERLTLRLKAGALTGSYSGTYGGAGAAFYLHRYASLFAEGDYMSMKDVTGWTGTAGVELLLSRRVPLSLRAGTSYSTTEGSSTTSFFVSVRFRINVTGPLVELDRSGPISWNGGLSLL